MYLILFFFIILFLFIYNYKYNKTIINGGNICIFPNVYNKKKTFIGHLTGNISDFRDLSNNYYCSSPIRIG